MRSTPNAAATPAAGAALARVLWLTPSRVFYRGLLGAPSPLVKGALLVYAADTEGLRVRVGSGPWREARLAVMQPYERHQVATPGRLATVLMVEPESVDIAALPAVLRGASGPVEDADGLARVLAARESICAAAGAFDADPAGFDRLFFGADLAPRRLDARIAEVVARLGTDPAHPHTAQQWAAGAGLSYSRFLHLFARECGTSYRAFRAWKRARSLLHHVTREASLTDVALDIGYPDATHFSHSIRRIYGLKPRDIFAGSRRLAVLRP